MFDVERRHLSELRYFGQRMQDAVAAAIATIGDGPIAGELHRFRADHRRHAERIDDAFSILGSGPSRLDDAFARYADAEAARVTGSRGPDEAAQALLEAERAVARSYRTAIEAGVGEEVLLMLREHLDDESQHVRFLEHRTPAVLGYAEERARGAGGGGEARPGGGPEPGEGVRLPGQPLPDTELPPADEDEVFVTDDAHVVRGTPGEAGSEVAHRPDAPGEGFPGGGDMRDADVERELEDL